MVGRAREEGARARGRGKWRERWAAGGDDDGSHREGRELGAQARRLGARNARHHSQVGLAESLFAATMYRIAVEPHLPSLYRRIPLLGDAVLAVQLDYFLQAVELDARARRDCASCRLVRRECRVGCFFQVVAQNFGRVREAHRAEALAQVVFENVALAVDRDAADLNVAAQPVREHEVRCGCDGGLRLAFGHGA